MRLVLVLLIFGLFLGGFATPSSAEPKSVTTMVPAQAKQWVGSGVEVRKGQIYKITASGSWTVNECDCDWSGPDGGSGPCSKPLEYQQAVEASYSALIAKIGNGPAFLVGGGIDLTADRSGTLYFRVNDSEGYFSNNDGTVKVQTTPLTK